MSEPNPQQSPPLVGPVNFLDRRIRRGWLSFFFAVTASLAISLAIIVVNRIIGDLAEDNLIRLAEEGATRETLHIQSMLRSLPSMQTLPSDGAISDGNALQNIQPPTPLTLESLTSPEGLSTYFPSLSEGLNIVKFNLFDLNGKTVWSTDPEAIGIIKRESPLFQKAVAGGSSSSNFSKLARDHEVVHLDRVSRRTDVVETYLPLRETPSGRIIGVMAIYRDVADDIAIQVIDAKSTVLWTTIAAMGGLFLLLFSFIIVADVNIYRSRSREMLIADEANQFLEARVRQRTQELEEVNLQLRKLSQAVEQSPGAVVITDTDAKIEYINPKFTEITGYTLEEVAGSTPDILQSGETPREVYQELWGAIAAGQEWQGELLNRKKNGEVYWALESISGIKDSTGAISHFLGIEQDVTQRKESEESLHLRTQELEALLNMSEILSRSISFEEKCQQISELLTDTIAADRVILWQLNEEYLSLNQLTVTTPEGKDKELTYGTSWGEGVAGAALKEGTVIVSNNYPDDPGAKPQTLARGTKSLVALPLKSADRTLGVITIASNAVDHFTPYRVNLLTAIGEGLGTLLEKDRLSSELQSHTDQIALVDQIGQIITSTLEIEQVYERFALEMKKLVDFDRVIITVANQEASTYVIKYLLGEDQSTRVGVPLPLEGSQTQLIIQTGRTLIREDVLQDARFNSDQAHAGMGLRSNIAIPLSIKGRVIGLLGLRSRRTGAYGIKEQSILERLASQIAPAIDNARLFEETNLARDSEQQRSRENELLADLSRSVSNTISLESALDEIAAKVGEMVSHDRISIVLVSDKEDTTTMKSCFRGLAVPGWGSPTLAFNQSFPQEIINIGTTLLQGDELEQAVDRIPSIRAGQEIGFRSWLEVPLVANCQVIGALTLQSQQEYAFTEYHVSLAERIALQLAPAIENTLLYQEIQDRAAETALADEVARIITSTLDIQEVYEKFALEMKKLVEFDRAAISIIDHQSGTYTLKYVFGLPRSARPLGTRIPLEGSQAMEILNTGHTMIREDTNASPRFASDRQGPGEAELRANISVPLKSNGVVFGTLHLRSQKAGIYGPREQVILERLSHQIAPALENARLYEEARFAEQALRENEARFRDLYNEAPIGYQEMDSEGRITRVNRTELDMLGYTAEEMLGEPGWKFIVEEGLSKEATAAKLTETIALGSAYERSFRRKDGSIMPALLDSKLLRDDQGQVVGLRCTIQDITERKGVEEQRRALEVQMLGQSKLATLGEVATGVAHEINQPLTYINTAIQTLQEDFRLNDVDEERMNQLLTESGRQVTRISSIVQHLRTFGRNGDRVRSQVQLEGVLDNTLLLLSERLRLRNIQLVQHVEKDLPAVRGDPNQLEQVLINLFQNAIDALANQKESAEINVTISSSPDQATVQTKFSDNGAGIPPELLDKIFEPFFTTKEVGHGTGLGLSIIYGIIQDHQGTIDCVSELNKGTTFIITLPAGEVQHV
ncbi:MAG: GAF domain-containing protein [Dehalococcoidia bacterium]